MKKIQIFLEKAKRNPADAKKVVLSVPNLDVRIGLAKDNVIARIICYNQSRGCMYCPNCDCPNCYMRFNPLPEGVPKDRCPTYGEYVNELREIYAMKSDFLRGGGAEMVTRLAAISEHADTCVACGSDPMVGALFSEHLGPPKAHFTEEQWDDIKLISSKLKDKKARLTRAELIRYEKFQEHCLGDTGLNCLRCQIEAGIKGIPLDLI